MPARRDIPEIRSFPRGRILPCRLTQGSYVTLAYSQLCRKQPTSTTGSFDFAQDGATLFCLSQSRWRTREHAEWGTHSVGVAYRKIRVGHPPGTKPLFW